MLFHWTIKSDHINPNMSEPKRCSLGVNFLHSKLWWASIGAFRAFAFAFGFFFVDSHEKRDQTPTEGQIESYLRRRENIRRLS